MAITMPDIPDNAFAGMSGITEGTGRDGVGDLADVLQKVKTDLAAQDTKTGMLTNATAVAGAKIDLAEGTDNGTSKVTMQAPASLAANRTITVPDADVVLADIAANKTKTDLITRETAGAGAKIELPEATANGVNKVIVQSPALLGADRTITVPDADVTLADIAANKTKTDLITRETAGVAAKMDFPEATANGVHKVTAQPPAALASDRTLTLPDADIDLNLGTRKVTVAVSTAEITNLHAAAKELIAAPGAGFYVDVIAATIRAVFGTTALDDAAADGNLRVKTAGGREIAICEADGVVDAVANTVRALRPNAPVAADIQNVTPANEAIQLDNDGAAFTNPGAGDTTLSVDVYFRVLPL